MKILLNWALILLFPLCTRANQGFVIKGKITGVRSGYVSIEEHKHEGGDHDAHDHAHHQYEKVRIENGEFVFRGKLEHPDLVVLKISTKTIPVLLENADYTMECDFWDLSPDCLKGGVLHPQFRTFLASGLSYARYVAANPDLEVSGFLTFRLAHSKSKLKEAYDQLSDRVRNTYFAKEAKRKLDALDKVGKGAEMPHFMMEDPSGKKFSVKDMAGKVVVLDFWASWCGPCKAFVPTMREYYNRFKDRGVVFVAVSFDEDRERWTRAMGELKMAWKQGIVEGGFGDNSPVKKMLQIRSIPLVIVVGKDGKIAEWLDSDSKDKLPLILDKLSS